MWAIFLNKCKNRPTIITQDLRMFVLSLITLKILIDIKRSCIEEHSFLEYSL